MLISEAYYDMHTNSHANLKSRAVSVLVQIQLGHYLS